MFTPVEFRNFLWREFEAAGLIPDSSRYKEAREEVSRCGIIELGRIKSLVGEAIWRQSLTRLKRPYPEEDCARVLGFGHVLTLFAVAPLNLPDAEREAVVHLGALANFIVAAYDHLVDLGINRQVLLPRWMLRLAAQGKGQSWITVLQFMSSYVSRMIARLVMIYFRHLGKLPYGNKHISIQNHVKQTILRMYDLENETLGRQGKYLLDERRLWMKAALPFVVMGLPAWLGMPEVCPRRYWWHLRWLYRLGEVFGWIDDVVDFEEDLKTSQPNRLVNVRAKLRYSQTDADLARMIAHRGKRILAEWHLQIGNVNHLPRVVREAFSTCLVSWFGGM